MFTKRHYKLIADTIVKATKIERVRGERVVDFGTMVVLFLALFEEDNPRFSRDKFIEACKGE